MKILLAVIVCYLTGTLHAGFFIGKIFFNKDVRDYGSGNIGATNTSRVLGKKIGVTVLGLDILKGILAVLLGLWIYDGKFIGIPSGLLGGFCAIVGHNWPFYLKFKGGKGVATSAGVFVALTPIPMIIGFIVFIIIWGWKRMVSLGSLTATAVVVILIAAGDYDAAIKFAALIAGILITYKHRSNIIRIVQGKENKV